MGNIDSKQIKSEQYIQDYLKDFYQHTTYVKEIDDASLTYLFAKYIFNLIY